MVRILVAEDQDDLRAVIRKILELDDHEVITAADGWRAVRALEEGGADLILTDVYMPDVGGVELILRLQHLEETAPVIVMSGGGWEDRADVLERARSVGAVATLEKPFDVKTLRNLVRLVLDGSTAGRSSAASGVDAQD